ncbi:MAG: glycerol kinase GlpK [Anaerolineaceae bacterium]|nr:glycerol kinase GlpK [Anaerolineaceae bacterium]
MQKFILSIDQGTTSTRCIIFDQSGSIIASDQKEHTQIYPQPGWVEHDPQEIWINTVQMINGAILKAGLNNKDISAIGITNQRETTVAWNRITGKVYGNAIVWQDTRTDRICNQLAETGGQDRFRASTGLPLATYFSGPKIKWMLDNIPGLRMDAEAGQAVFGNIDSWLIWNLTGGKQNGIHATDVSNASRTLLMNLGTLTWNHEICSMLEIPVQSLPQICPSSSHFGYCTELLEGVPITGVLGDQQAALFGQTCFNKGEAKNTYGTGCFMLMNTGTEPIQSKFGLLTTVGYKIGNEPAVYCLEGSIAITGALVQWLRDNLKLIETSDEIESLAATVEDNGGIYFVPAFSGLFAPYWRSDARGIIAGITRFVNRGHIARAVLESTAFQTREVFEAMEKDSDVNLTSLRVDGGMVKNSTLMQFQADILNVPVQKPLITETTALGAAYAAGLQVGYWQSLEELKSNWKIQKTWNPAMPDVKRNELYSFWKKAVGKSMDWID